MILKIRNYWRTVVVSCGALGLALATQAQTVTNPVPNLMISWNLDDWSTINPTDLAGLAPATNWVDTYLNNITLGLPDNTGAATTMNLGSGSYNTYHVYGSHLGFDANGTKNREMLNGYLNNGYTSPWNVTFTNTYVSLTNIPYARYDVVVYFNSDTSGRHASIDNGSATYYFSTMGSAAVNGGNTLFVPTTQTNSTIFPNADFAFFPSMTSPNAIFTAMPKSGQDQWLGIAAFQVIQASNVYVLYGPSPASQIVPVGQPASFSVMAGGLNPSYQWQHAGTNLLNATNTTYSIAAPALGQDGNYDVIVSNSFNSVTSAVATLTFYTPKTVEWDGNGTIWDTSSLFWTVNGGASTTNYTETDNVRFGPLGSGQPIVSLGSTFTPSSITVSNGVYLLTSGGLAGSGSLHLMNNATLGIDTVDTRTGPTLIDNGSTLQLDNGDTAGSLGSGALTNNGALLFNANGDEAYGYPIYGTGGITNVGPSGTITLGNNVNANYLVQSGNGVLLLQGNNSLSGGLVVASGTVLARSLGALGNAPVLLSGGELQLIYSFDFVAPSLTLSGGTLHGTGGDSIFEGVVELTTDSQINVDSGNSLTLNNASGISASGFNLYLGGGGTLILAGANNTWNSLNITVGTVQIGNGGGGSLGGGAIADVGALAFNVAGNLLVTNPIIDSGLINQIGAGTVIFTGDASGFNGTTTVAAGGLGGTTTFGGPMTILPGGTLAPGTPSAIGTLTLNGGLTIGGNVLVKVNKSLVQSNDFVSVSGALGNTNNGVVMVNNLGSALAAGDKFTLFSQPVAGGATLSVSGGGVVWSNNLANDGSIIVLSAAVPHPVIRTINISGGNVVISGTNGTISGTCYLLSSTNLTTPFANWVRVSTNGFDSSGNFNITNAIGGAPQNFYILQSSQ